MEGLLWSLVFVKEGRCAKLLRFCAWLYLSGSIHMDEKSGDCSMTLSVIVSCSSGI